MVTRTARAAKRSRLPLGPMTMTLELVGDGTLALLHSTDGNATTRPRLPLGKLLLGHGRCGAVFSSKLHENTKLGTLIGTKETGRVYIWAVVLV